MVDRVFQLLQIIPAASYAGKRDYDEFKKRRTIEADGKGEYLVRKLEAGDVRSGTFFPGRGLEVMHKLASGTEVSVAAFGVVHPEVLENFDWRYPVSAVELNLEHFL